MHKGPVSYRAAIVLTATGMLLLAMTIIFYLETAGMYHRGHFENWLILVGLVSGFALFVIGAIDGSQREVEQLAEEKR